MMLARVMSIYAKIKGTRVDGWSNKIFYMIAYVLAIKKMI